MLKHACAFLLMMTAPAMAPLRVSEIAPGTTQTTDDEILDWVRRALGIDWPTLFAAAPTGSPMSCRQSKKQIRS